MGRPTRKVNHDATLVLCDSSNDGGRWKRAAGAARPDTGGSAGGGPVAPASYPPFIIQEDLVGGQRLQMDRAKRFERLDKIVASGLPNHRIGGGEERLRLRVPSPSKVVCQRPEPAGDVVCPSRAAQRWAASPPRGRACLMSDGAPSPLCFAFSGSRQHDEKATLSLIDACLGRGIDGVSWLACDRVSSAIKPTESAQKRRPVWAAVHGALVNPNGSGTRGAEGPRLDWDP